MSTANLPLAGVLSGKEIMEIDRGGQPSRLPLSQLFLTPFKLLTTNYSLDFYDAQILLDFNNASGVICSLPVTLPQGWSCGWRQSGAGVITFSGASILGFGSPTGVSAGQYAIGGLLVVTNPDNKSAVYQLTGNVS